MLGGLFLHLAGHEANSTVVNNIALQKLQGGLKELGISHRPSSCFDDGKGGSRSKEDGEKIRLIKPSQP
jgi:hypothetical protein